MAADITVADLTNALRLTASTPVTSEITRLRSFALGRFALLSPDAPTPIANQALVQYVGYLFNRPFAGPGDYANAYRNSGAAELLAPYRVAATIVPSNPVTPSNPGGGGTGLTIAQIVTALELLTGDARLDYGALKDRPSIPTLRTAAQTALLLETLTGANRLDASAIKNLPMQLTGPEIVTVLSALTGNARLPGSAVDGVLTEDAFIPKSTDGWYQWSSNGGTFNAGIGFYTSTIPAAANIIGNTTGAEFDASGIRSIQVSKYAYTAPTGTSTKTATPSTGDVVYLHSDPPYQKTKYLRLVLGTPVAIGHSSHAYNIPVTSVTQVGGNFSVGANNRMRLTDEIPTDVVIPGNHVMPTELLLDGLAALSTWSTLVQSPLTGGAVVALLSALTGANRLSATAIKDLPSTGLTTPQADAIGIVDGLLTGTAYTRTTKAADSSGTGEIVVSNNNSPLQFGVANAIFVDADNDAAALAAVRPGQLLDFKVGTTSRIVGIVRGNKTADAKVTVRQYWIEILYQRGVNQYLQPAYDQSATITFGADIDDVSNSIAELRAGLPFGSLVTDGNLSTDTELLLKSFGFTSLGELVEWHDEHHTGLQSVTGLTYNTSSAVTDAGDINYSGGLVTINPANAAQKSSVKAKIVAGRKATVRLSDTVYVSGFCSNGVSELLGKLNFNLTTAKGSGSAPAWTGIPTNNHAVTLETASNIPARAELAAVAFSGDYDDLTDKPAAELPTVSASDNGDVLTVVSGAWGKATPASGGGGANSKAVSITSGYSAVPTTLTDITGMSITITPSATTKKILLTFGGMAGDGDGVFRAIIYRDAATDVDVGYCDFWPKDTAGNIIPMPSVARLDSPATTSAVTYKVKAIKYGTFTPTVSSLYPMVFTATEVD